MQLALDLGSKMGVAWTDDECPDCYRYDCLRLIGRKFKDRGVRYLAFWRFLNRLLPSPEVIYYEQVRRHKSTDSAHVHGGFRAVLEMYCISRQIPLIGLGVGEIKIHATGRGNADKPAMIAAARSRLDYDGNDPDEADALWILDRGISRS